MIAANQLRFGNYVDLKWREDKIQNGPYRVYGVDYLPNAGHEKFHEFYDDPGKSTVKVYSVNVCASVNPEKLYGIPLTPEILLKCDFVCDGEMNRFDMEKRGVIFCADEPVSSVNCFSDHGDEFGIPVKHLHELQNLYFALTGEELIYTP